MCHWILINLFYSKFISHVNSCIITLLGNIVHTWCILTNKLHIYKWHSHLQVELMVHSTYWEPEVYRMHRERRYDGARRGSKAKQH